VARNSSLAQILIEAPSRRELEQLATVYETLVASLAADGHEVELRAGIQRRGLGDVVQEVALHVATNVDAYVEGAIAACVARWLRTAMARGQDSRASHRVRIYAPDGRLLREVDIRDAADDSAAR
jgi:hypothetical protein